jgi:hypothetical protein
MAADTETCDVCNGESGGSFVGVASIPGAPMSIAWCDKCIRHEAIPEFVAQHDFIFVASGDLSRLVDWARQRSVWADGGYLEFEEYVKRISPADVQKAFDGYATALEAVQPDDLD